MIEETDIRFGSELHLLQVIDRIVAQTGRRIDESSPMVDARLPDGSRVNAIIPPLAITGPSLTIRKFSREPLTMDDLVGFGTLSHQAAAFLEACVSGKLNVLVSGGTGTGKTTMLNVLSSFIPEHERIVTIEDAAELKLHQEHVIALEARPAQHRGPGRRSRSATWSQRAAHAPRPDRRRRVPWRRGRRHAAGHEHRPRRLADDHPRQQPARRPGAHRDAGADRRLRHAAEGHPRPDLERV